MNAAALRTARSIKLGPEDLATAKILAAAGSRPPISSGALAMETIRSYSIRGTKASSSG